MCRDGSTEPSPDGDDIVGKGDGTRTFGIAGTYGVGKGRADEEPNGGNGEMMAIFCIGDIAS
jgi:hypothetical protein